MLTGPTHVFDFVCQQTGRCCNSGWKVELSHYDQVNLMAKGRGTPLEARLEQDVVPDPAPQDGEDYQRTYHLRKGACGGCSFLDGKSCKLHATLGPLALPDPCRNFPVIATQTAWGVEVGYNLTCPHAISLTAKSPFVISRREDWERPLDPQQSRASFIPPPEGWKTWRTARNAAIAALESSSASLLDEVAVALGHVTRGPWDAAAVTSWCDGLDIAERIAVSFDECGPFLETWGPRLQAPPEWSSVTDGLASLSADDALLVRRYLQHTVHTVYFRTGQPTERAYRWALAAFATVLRLSPAMARAYPKAPVRAAIVLTEMGIFGDLRTLESTPLPA